MWKWRSEALFHGRYALAGILNGIVGVGAIWLLTGLGAHPAMANFLGYGAALAVGFVGAKRFVFRSQGRVTPEALRYLASFATCYLINLGTLFACLSWLAIRPIWAQGAAILSYVTSMYLLSRLFVFSGKAHDRG